MSGINIITANFTGNRDTTTRKLFQYDYGQKLKIKGLNLPNTFQVDFSNQKMYGTAKKVFGSNNEVDIPDEYLLSGQDIYAFIFLHQQNSDGETRHIIKIPVNKRSKSSEEQPTPIQRDTIETAIAALNEAVQKTQQNVQHYPKIVNGHWYIYDVQLDNYIDTNIKAEGDSAYEVAVDQGYSGTIGEWIASLRGDPGTDGHSPQITASKSNKTTTIYVDGTAIATIEDGESDGGLFDYIAKGTGTKSLKFNNINNTDASGNYSMAQGNNTTASGDYSHAEGNSTTASGDQSHAEGYQTESFGDYSHAEGRNTLTSDNYAHAEGYKTIASGSASHAQGNETTASGNDSHAEGHVTSATGSQSHSQGSNTVASGGQSHAEGYRTIASNNCAHAEGENSVASGQGSHAQGGYCPSITLVLTGDANAKQYTYLNTLPYLLRKGLRLRKNLNDKEKPYYIGAINTNNKTITFDRTLDQNESFSQRVYYFYPTTVAEGNSSHAEGNGSTAIRLASHAEGYQTVADGEASHAEGYQTTAFGDYSHAEGYNTIANRKSQHVFGEYNIQDSYNSVTTNRGKYIEIVGNGTSPDRKANARTLDWDGNEILAGKLTVGAAPSENMDVTTKQYVDSKVNNKQDALTFDTTPTLSSVNPVTSNGIKVAIDNLGRQVDWTDNLEAEIAKTGYYLVWNMDRETVSSAFGISNYIDISQFNKISYKRIKSTSSITSIGIVFYDTNKTYISGISALTNQTQNGYASEFHTVEIPENAVYVRFTIYLDTLTYGVFEAYGKYSLTDRIEKLEVIIPPPPSSNGSYVLKCTVNNKVPSYAWINE